MVADVVADLQQQGDGELADGGGTVGGHVGDGNALFLGINIVHHIVAGGQHTDHLHVGAGVDNLFGNGSLIGKDHLGVADAGDSLVLISEAATVIDSELAQLSQLVPAQIAGVFRIAVQDHNLHENFPPYGPKPFIFLLYHIPKFNANSFPLTFSVEAL